MKKTTGMAMVVALLVGAAMNVSAGESGAFGDQEAKVRTVRFDDLDLRKPAGVAMLHARLRAAASNVCMGLNSDLRGIAAYDKCRISALDGAVSGLPAAVQTHHANWVAAGSKWYPRLELRPVQQLAARR